MAAVGTQIRAPSGSSGVSRLAMMQERMRENIRQEKESRMLEMVAKRDAEREDIINRVNRNSTSLSESMSSLHLSGAGQGRVRKMLEERRTNPASRSYNSSPKGYDKSYPLDPMMRGANRPPARASHQNNRGVNVERTTRKQDTSSMIRSRSQVTMDRANKGNSRLPSTSKSFEGLRVSNYHKSASSLLDSNSRGPSPGPPLSTKSSPGIAPNRTRKPPSIRANPPTPRPVSDAPKPPPRKPFASRTTKQDDVYSNLQTPPSSNGVTSKSRPKPQINGRAVPPPKTPAAKPKLEAPPRKRDDGLPSCKICGRTFAADRIEKHQEICSKSKAKSKKRKVFDPTKMRTKGTEAESYVARGLHKKEKPKKKSDWRKKHDELIQTLRAAKGVAGYVAPPIDTSDYVQCPHCGRKFNEAAADRHIPKCSSIQSNKNRR